MRRLEVPIVQGLISSGQVKTPPDSDWIHDGKLDPAAITKDPIGFNTWWTQNAKAGTPALDLFGQAKNGYNDATPQRAANSDGAQDGQ